MLTYMHIALLCALVCVNFVNYFLSALWWRAEKHCRNKLRSPRPVAPLTLVESRNKWDCVAVACSFLLECTFDSFPISRGSRCLGLSNYFTDKRFHLLYINGGYYIYIIGVTIGGHTYGQREELQFDFSVAGSHRHRLHQHTHKHTCTCMRSNFHTVNTLSST